MKDYSLKTVGIKNYMMLIPGSAVKSAAQFIARYFHVMVILAVCVFMYYILTQK